MCISAVWVEKKNPDLSTHFFQTCYSKHTYFFYLALGTLIKGTAGCLFTSLFVTGCLLVLCLFCGCWRRLIVGPGMDFSVCSRAGFDVITCCGLASLYLTTSEYGSFSSDVEMLCSLCMTASIFSSKIVLEVSSCCSMSNSASSRSCLTSSIADSIFETTIGVPLKLRWDRLRQSLNRLKLSSVRNCGCSTT